MYDITNKQSFEDVKNWYDEACNYGNNQMYFILLGNKCELSDQR